MFRILTNSSLSARLDDVVEQHTEKRHPEHDNLLMTVNPICEGDCKSVIVEMYMGLI